VTLKAAAGQRRRAVSDGAAVAGRLPTGRPTGSGWPDAPTRGRRRLPEEPALIRHFFGDKDGLFAATLQVPDEAVKGVLDAFDGPIDLLVERLARAHLPGDHVDLRLVLALNHLMGIALGRHLFKAPPLSECDLGTLGTLIAIVAPAVQNYLTGPLPTASAGQPAIPAGGRA
jgi:hypothetical protein